MRRCVSSVVRALAEAAEISPSLTKSTVNSSFFRWIYPQFDSLIATVHPDPVRFLPRERRSFSSPPGQDNAYKSNNKVQRTSSNSNKRWEKRQTPKPSQFDASRKRPTWNSSPDARPTDRQRESSNQLRNAQPKKLGYQNKDRPPLQRARPAAGKRFARPVPWWERQQIAEQAVTQRSEETRKGALGNLKSKSKASKVPPEPKPIIIPDGVTVTKLAQLLGVGVNDLERVLNELGDPPKSEEDTVAMDAAELAALELGKNAVIAPSKSTTAKMNLPFKPAVVTVMGHVDHGKTTLLDALRSTSIAAREAGGITQHVGAFEITLPESGRSLTFLDTPGHAAFSAMRARGALVTDIVVLVVAADDGVMPQTREALSHARAAGCPIVVAITKCDLSTADPARVRKQLASEGLFLEGSGGEVQAVEVSASTGLGLAALEEALLLESEMLDLRADVNAPPAGTVIEARLDRGHGPMATVIVTKGTLKVGQAIVAGAEWGKIRALRTPGIGETSLSSVDDVGPGRPVEVVGLKGLPLAGDELMGVFNEDRARRVSEARATRAEDARFGIMASNAGNHERSGGKGPLERAVPVVVKADVQGSLEAVRDAVGTLTSDAVRLQIIHAGVGPVTLSDVALAVPSAAAIIAFNVKLPGDAEAEAKARGVTVLMRRVIYELMEDVAAIVEGATPRELKQVVVGTADVLATFRVSVKTGKVNKRLIAGCRVTDGALRSGLIFRVVRGEKVIAEGLCDSLRRQKLDVDLVGNGAECGVALEGFDDFLAGDVLHCIEQK